MIAALNAARWWSLPKIPSQDSRVWKTWIVRCGARHGGATRVDLLHRHLGLAAVEVVPEAHAIEDAIAQDIPVEGTIWVPSAGLHAILRVPGRDAQRKPCTIAIGMIREKPANAGTHEYVSERTSVKHLLDRYCFPVGNPNRRFTALVPKKGRCT